MKNSPIAPGGSEHPNGPLPRCASGLTKPTSSARTLCKISRDKFGSDTARERLSAPSHTHSDQVTDSPAMDEQRLEWRPAVNRPTPDIWTMPPTPQAFAPSRSSHGNSQDFGESWKPGSKRAVGLLDDVRASSPRRSCVIRFAEQACGDKTASDHLQVRAW